MRFPQRLSLTAVIFLIFLVAGVGLLLGCGYWAWQKHAWIRDASRARGTVVELLVRSSRGHPTYRPLIEFTDSGGRAVRFEHNVSSRPAAYEVGEAVEVLYAPQASDDAALDSSFILWMGPAILGFLGAIFTFLGGIGSFLFVSVGPAPSFSAPSRPRAPLQVPTAVRDQARALVDGGQAIEAIKVVREATGCSLLEANDYVDGVRRS